MLESIWVIIKAHIHIHIWPILNLMGPYVPMMGQHLGPIDYGLIFCGLQFQPVIIYTLDKLSLLPCLITGAFYHILGENYLYNVYKHLVTWEEVYLMPQVGVSLINEVDLPHDTIRKCTRPLLEPNMLPKVSLNGIVLLFSSQMVVKVYDDLYYVFPVINSGVVL